MTDEQITTTLAEIRSHGPCEKGFAKIRNHFGVSPSDAKMHDNPFPVSLLLETNDLDDCLWVTAHVAPDAITRFLIKRLDTGEHSALKTLRHLNGNFSEQVYAVENVVSLLRRKLAGESVESDLRDAARAAAAARAYAATAHATHVAGAAARAAAAAANEFLNTYAAHATHATHAARAAAVNDLKEILG